MELSNNARFLRFVRIMVDETRKDAPLSRDRILQMTTGQKRALYWYDEGWI